MKRCFAHLCLIFQLTLIAIADCPAQTPAINHAAKVEQGNKIQALSNKPFAPEGFRLPGEFERHRSLLLSTGYLTSDAPRVFAELVRGARSSMHVVALFNDTDDLEFARTALTENQLPLNSVKFLPVEHNTMWVRDYAPLVLVGPENQTILVDGAYDEANRPADDLVPQVLAEQLHLPLLSTALKIDGGNLLSNGEGIIVATTSLIQCNVDLGWGKKEIYDRLLRLCNAKAIVLVEPLQGEPTTHVDMFAAFVSADTIVVGAYGDEDEENSAILDRNATVLGHVETSSGPLRVVRIPMPRHDDGIWRTHANVVFTNNSLLVPIYPDQDDRHTMEVMKTYRELLPTRRIIAIDAEKISERGGSLHCITMHLGPIDGFPTVPLPRSN
ncbi:MAG: agmatine deiminase family protein [Planctomycetaceae bacterium]|nr:agmatine deiminase family protein [Planctomycetales bacterium]MCB9923809.1 agmatine deiminase family protein [Planctomycetaceae bacterium]